MYYSIVMAIMLCVAGEAHIDAAIDLSLVGQRRAIVVFDSYKGYARANNLVHAASLVKASEKIALSMPDASIDVGFEDPAVYDMGNLLKHYISLLAPHLHQHDKEKSFYSLIPSFKKPGFCDILAFAKPKELTTFLAGDLTRALAITPSWPDNLMIHSNDPRHEHFLSLIKGQSWLKDNGKHMRMKNLITAAPLLEARRKIFKIDPGLSLEQRGKITQAMNEFAHLEQKRLEDFANYASMKSGKEIVVSDLDKSICALEKEVPLSMVYDYLMEAKSRTDYYSDGPLVDVYLTMFNQYHPDIMIIVLGNHLAKKLVKELNDLGVIERANDIKNAADWFLRVAQGKESLPVYE